MKSRELAGKDALAPPLLNHRHPRNAIVEDTVVKVPIVAMLTAAVFLGERITVGRLAGAAAVLIGVALTRVGKVAPLVPPQD